MLMQAAGTAVREIVPALEIADVTIDSDVKKTAIIQLTEAAATKRFFGVPH